MPSIEETRVLSTPAVRVNGEQIPIIPNSATMPVTGEVAVRAVSGGGLSTEVVVGTDGESLKGRFSFDIANTSANLKRVRAWKDAALAGTGVTVEVEENNVQFPFVRMFLVNEPDAEFSAEGNISCEFEGTRLA